MIHKMVRVSQETFLKDVLLKKDYPPQSSTIQRIWHLPRKLIPAITGTTKARVSEMKKKKTVEYVNDFTPFPKWRWHVESYWWNLFSQ